MWLQNFSLSLTGENQYSGVLWFSSIIAPEFAFCWRCCFSWYNPQVETVSRCLIFNLIKKKIEKHCKENVMLMLNAQLQINWYHTCRLLIHIPSVPDNHLCGECESSPAKWESFPTSGNYREIINIGLCRIINIGLCRSKDIMWQQLNFLAWCDLTWSECGPASTERSPEPLLNVALCKIFPWKPIFPAQPASWHVHQPSNACLSPGSKPWGEMNLSGCFVSNWGGYWRP